MEVDKLLSEARKIWGDDKLTLEEIVLPMRLGGNGFYNGVELLKGVF
jgi:hypothetical protein